MTRFNELSVRVISAVSEGEGLEVDGPAAHSGPAQIAGQGGDDLVGTAEVDLVLGQVRDQAPQLPTGQVITGSPAAEQVVQTGAAGQAARPCLRRARARSPSPPGRASGSGPRPGRARPRPRARGCRTPQARTMVNSPGPACRLRSPRSSVDALYFLCDAADPTSGGWATIKMADATPADAGHWSAGI
jgi:hypothetical protein